MGSGRCSHSPWTVGIPSPGHLSHTCPRPPRARMDKKCAATSFRQARTRPSQFKASAAGIWVQDMLDSMDKGEAPGWGPDSPSAGAPAAGSPLDLISTPGGSWAGQPRAPEPPSHVCLYRPVLCSAHPTRSGPGAVWPPLGPDLMPESVVQWSRTSLKYLTFAGLNLNVLFSSWDPWKAMHLL